MATSSNTNYQMLQRWQFHPIPIQQSCWPMQVDGPRRVTVDNHELKLNQVLPHLKLSS